MSAHTIIIPHSVLKNNPSLDGPANKDSLPAKLIMKSKEVVGWRWPKTPMSNCELKIIRYLNSIGNNNRLPVTGWYLTR